MESSKADFITVINSTLLLIDYQVNILKRIGSVDINEIINSAVNSAKAASILQVPVVLTSFDPQNNGEFIKELRVLFPMKKVVSRSLTSFDPLEDEKVLREIRKTGREKIILSGLFTSTNFVNAALHGIREGFDVYGLIDASGDTTVESHNSAVQRMLEAGVTPVTWMSLIAEWMNGWSDSQQGDSPNEVSGKYSVMLSYLSKQQPVINDINEFKHRYAV